MTHASDDATATAAKWPETPLTGTLNIFVAFDWGEEVDLEAASKLVPCEPQELARRRRTPSSIAYHPVPLRFRLPPIHLELGGFGAVAGSAEAILFDFAAVSLALRVPFRETPANLLRHAASLADIDPVVQTARTAIDSLFQQLSPAIHDPRVSRVCEEYLVWQITPDAAVPDIDSWLTERVDWLAGLVRLEENRLSREEVSEATRLRLSYSPRDLFISDWAAAVLIDRDCDETLQVIEFANLQLLEFREIDQRLDLRMSAAYGLIQPLVRRWLPFWRTHMRPLRALGELRIDAHSVFERTSNALKLVGDQYLARVYRLISARFHLDQWEQSIRHSLEVLQSVHSVLSDQSAKYRTEVLELIIVFLILFEIVMAFVRK
jgi:hypothetical protein